MFASIFLSAFLASSALALPKPQSGSTDDSLNIEGDNSMLEFSSSTATPAGDSGFATSMTVTWNPASKLSFSFFSTFLHFSDTSTAATFPIISPTWGTDGGSFPTATGFSNATGTAIATDGGAFPTDTAVGTGSYYPTDTGAYYPTDTGAYYPTDTGSGAYPSSTGGASSNSSLQYCDAQPYTPDQYTCYDGSFLCPVIGGIPTLRCGPDCYLPNTIYGCNGTTLFSLPSGTGAVASGASFPAGTGAATDGGSFATGTGFATDSGSFATETGFATDSGSFATETGFATESGSFAAATGSATEGGFFASETGFATDGGFFATGTTAATDGGSFATDASFSAESTEFSSPDASKFKRVVKLW
ncbi:MAG: hypothetical protein LQ342_003596 [Letrouitia transgressa]|nr:MAG: hypothetical protein LQ342_003596 [Letrouitia transgressa]